MNNKRLLTLNDLYDFYSKKKKSMNFDCAKSGYNIVVQTEAKLHMSSEDLSEGLLYAEARAFHDLTNNNRSHIKTDVFNEKILSLKDRPIMADIIDTGEVDEDGNPIKDFSGHSMYYDESTDKFVYKEIPVGHFVNPESIRIEYDEEYERNFAVSDVVIYEEYTDACEILRRRETVDCSVELVIRSMSWNNTDKVLVLNDFYVQGCTLLGEGVSPGMSGSNVKLKDFAEKNNSLFSYLNVESDSRLIDTLDRLNTTLSNLQINTENSIKKKYDGEGVEQEVEKDMNLNENTELEFTEEEIVDKTLNEEFTVEADTETSEEIGDEFTEESNEKTEENMELTEAEFADGDDSEEEDDDSEEEDDDSEEEDSVATGDDEQEKKRFSFVFELSHGDIRASLYNLLSPLAEANNDWYWICEVYDDRVIYQSCMDGRYFGHAYSKDGDTVELTGDSYAVFAEFLTESERNVLEEMRSNYSSVQTELEKYRRKEEIEDKMTVFVGNDDYAKYLDTDEFKALMSEDNLISLTKDELIEKADSIVGKFARTKKIEIEQPKPEKHIFAFSGNNTECSFLDGLLNKK